MDFNHLLLIAHNIGQHLQAKNYPEFIDKVYGNKPNAFSPDLDLYQQMKFVVNACTRMRYLNVDDYSLDYKYKGEIINKPTTVIPWFLANFHASINKKILFGHWASLGFYQDDRCTNMDTGCVWGRSLTAMNLDTMEIIQVSNPKTR